MESLCERCGQPVGQGERLCKECAARLVPRKPKAAGAPTLPELPDLPSLDSMPPARQSVTASGPPAGLAGGAAQAEVDPFDAPLDLEEEFSPEQMAGVSAEELDAMEAAAGEKPRKTMLLAEPETETGMVSEAEAAAVSDEVTALAGYGPPPPSIATALPYAIRVWAKRRELDKAMAGLQEEKNAAAVRVDDALSELGAALYAGREQPALSPLKDLFEAVGKADETIEQNAGDRAQARQNAEATIEELQQKVQAAEREAEPYREKESEVKQRLAAAEKQRARARAMLQRVQIETRALQGAAEPPSQERIDSLQAAEQARQSELEVASARMAEISKELGQASLELAEKMKVVSAALSERQQAVEALEQYERDSEYRALQAEGEKRTALVAVASAALEQGRISKADAVSVTEAREHLAEIERGCEIHREALNCYDQDRFKQGVFTAAALAAVVLALIVVLIAI